jgi:hypothetical protein
MDQVISIINNIKGDNQLPFYAYLNNDQNLIHFWETLNVQDYEMLYEKRVINMRDIKPIQKYPLKKLEQIYSIYDLIKNDNFNRIVEMCCGKCYLSKFVSEKCKKPYVGIDYNNQFCNENVINMDLLKESFKYNDNDIVLSLHACGQLTDNIIESIIQSNKSLSGCIIPCCYWKYRDTYTFMSKKFKKLNIQIDKQVLHSLVNWKFRGHDDRQKKMNDNITKTKKIKIKICLILQKYEIITDKELKKDNFNIIKILKTKSVDTTNLNWDEIGKQVDVIYNKIFNCNKKLGKLNKQIEYLILQDKVEYFKDNGFNAKLLKICSSESTPRNKCIYFYKHI